MAGGRPSRAREADAEDGTATLGLGDARGGATPAGNLREAQAAAASGRVGRAPEALEHPFTVHGHDPWPLIDDTQPSAPVNHDRHFGRTRRNGKRVIDQIAHEIANQYRIAAHHHGLDRPLKCDGEAARNGKRRQKGDRLGCGPTQIGRLQRGHGAGIQVRHRQQLFHQATCSPSGSGPTR